MTLADLEDAWKKGQEALAGVDLSTATNKERIAFANAETRIVTLGYKLLAADMAMKEDPEQATVATRQ